MEISQPNRVSRTYTQRLLASPERVFPLLCPVREAEWIDGWDPGHVWTTSGAAEPGCVFTTPSPEGAAVWVITSHDLPNGCVAMIKVTPGSTVCRLDIVLTASDAGTDAIVTYEHTSIGPAGDAVVEGFTESYYREFMRDWESRLNHYLTTGRLLEGRRDHDPDRPNAE